MALTVVMIQCHVETSWETRGDIVIFQPINTNSKPQNIYSDFHVRYRSEELARSLLMSSNRFSGQSMISALAEFFYCLYH